MLGAWGETYERFNLVMHKDKRCRWEYGHYDSGKFSNPASTGMDSDGVAVSMDTEYGTLCNVTSECRADGGMSSTWTGSNGNTINATMNASETYGLIDTKATFFLFAARRKTGSTDGPSQYAYGILRSCKLWTDYDGTGTWTLVRDLRPCVKDGRAGLYDSVAEEILYPQGNELEPGPAKLDDGYSVGSNVHPATQWGRIGYAERSAMGNSMWMHLQLPDYAAIALSAQKGPDATAADIAEIAATTTILPMKRTMEIASGATLNLGGNTLTQLIVKGTGTIATGAGGSIVVSEKIVANVGECIEASGTIDLSNAKIELADPENLAEAFVFLKPTTGQTLTVIGVPTPVNLPRGWKVSVSPSGTCRIVKRGFMIFVK